MGTFIFSNDCPPCETTVRCEVLLPRLRRAGCIPIEATGQVFRVERGVDWREQGFAVVGDMLLLSRELSENTGERLAQAMSELLAGAKKLLN